MFSCTSFSWIANIYSIKEKANAIHMGCSNVNTSYQMCLNKSNINFKKLKWCNINPIMFQTSLHKQH